MVYRLKQFQIPAEILSKLHAIAPPHDNIGADKKIWLDDRRGNFTVSSAYRILAGTLDTNSTQINQNLPKIWQIESLERVHIFKWLIVHDRLLTNSRMASWYIVQPLEVSIESQISKST